MSAEVPVSTYRLQLGPGFTFDDATAIVDYLHQIGVSHVYLSPILQAAPGSTHGYDVVDHDRVSDELGGEQGFRRLIDALHERGMGAIADVVPNHMGMPVPESDNRALWSVLRDGPDSPFASWFDIDWSTQHGAVLLPVLGHRIGECVRAGEFEVDTSSDETVLRYYDHVFPLRSGTASLPLPELLQAQHYRLAHWRVAAEEPGYRRFFDISTLIAVRVEDSDVFTATHRLLLDFVADGSLDGLRIDHPDGLADPRGYLRRLAEASGHRWTVVEKILVPGEALPDDWPCAGTTGYDTLRAITALLVDPSGADQLRVLCSGLTGVPEDFDDVALTAKLDVLDQVLHPELDRLTEVLTAICQSSLDLHDHTHAALRDVTRALLAACPRYRAHVVPGEPPPAETVAILEDCAARAAATLPDERYDTLNLVRDLALGRIGPRDRLRDEFQIRFQQTSGPVQAKGLEDTAFYRWPALPTATEVGGDPELPALSPAEFHRYCADQQERHPNAMTALSTHDTKRSEDVRARLAVLTELPREWIASLTSWQAAARRSDRPGPADPRHQWPDPPTEYQIWQTLVGCWPLDDGRLLPFLTKAAREAKVHTSWTAIDEAYETVITEFARSVLDDPVLRQGIESFVRRISPYAEINSLTQKLVQLTMTGVPDVYQGTETEFLALVDPDNRRPVDFDALRGLLAKADNEGVPEEFAVRKVAVVSRTLRLRREHPSWFDVTASQTPLIASGPAAHHAIAFLRGDRIAVVGTRLPVGLERSGGWADTAISLPEGDWHCRLSGRSHHMNGRISVAELMRDLPVTLLVRED